MPLVTVYYRNTIGLNAEGFLQHSLKKVIADAITDNTLQNPVSEESVFIHFVEVPAKDSRWGEVFGKDVLVSFSLHAYRDRVNHGEKICKDISEQIKSKCSRTDAEVLTIISFVEMSFA